VELCGFLAKLTSEETRKKRRKGEEEKKRRGENCL
jgi:hypothetical protein